MKNALSSVWETVELGDVTICLDGERIPLNNEDRSKMKGNIPYYGANGQIDSINKHIFNDELLLLAEDGGSWGLHQKCSYIINGKSWVNNHAHVLKIKKGTDISYLMYFLNHHDLNQFISGTTRGKLNQGVMKKIPIMLPPLHVQKQIVSLLEKAEKLKEMRDEADKLTKEYLKAVFLEMFGDPGKNDKKWPIVKIDECVEYSQYGTSSKSNQGGKGYPIIGMNNISIEGNIDLSKYNYVEIPKQEFIKLKLSKGDVLFNRTNSPDLIGKTAYWDKDIDAVVASYLVKLRMKDKCNSVFFTYLMNTPYFKKIFYSSCKKAVNQANISPTLLKTFSIYLPPITLQNKFAVIVKNVVEMKKHQKQSQEQIHNLFNNVIQKAFKGELVC